MQCGRLKFDPWVKKIPWRREWLPTPIFWPGESHGQKSLQGYSPWGHKESDMTEQLTFSLSLWFSKHFGDWRAAIHGVAKSQTRLSDWTKLNWRSCQKDSGAKLKKFPLVKDGTIWALLSIFNPMIMVILKNTLIGHLLRMTGNQLILRNWISQRKKLSIYPVFSPYVSCTLCNQITDWRDINLYKIIPANKVKQNGRMRISLFCNLQRINRSRH